MARSRTSSRRLARTAVALALILAAITSLTTPLGAQEAPTADPEAAGGAADGQIPVGPDGAAIEPPVGAEASGLDRLAQLLTAPRPISRSHAIAAPEPAPPSGPPYRTGPASASPVIVPPPAVGRGDGTVYAVGDSVLLGTESYLSQTVGGWDLRLDARVSRRVPEGVDLIHANRDRLGQAVVICLGHNYGGGGSIYGYLDQMMADLRNVERVVFVTVAEWSPAQPEVNRAIRALPAFYPNVVVADWQAVSAANPSFLVGDRVHLSNSGNVALANLIAVMLGPANRDGTTVAPPRILDIPIETGPTTPPATSAPPSTATSTTTSTLAPSTTTSTVLTTTTTTADTTSTTQITTPTTPPSSSPP